MARAMKVMKEKCKPVANCGSGGAVYGLGFIGAAVFYISHSTGFWMGVVGFLKALVWPAFFVFDALTFIHP
jgi:hypothetical protein